MDGKEGGLGVVRRRGEFLRECDGYANSAPLLNQAIWLYRMATLTPGATNAPSEEVLHAIQIVRGQRVILDRDLARLYGVTTKRFNEAVKRNTARFPLDFMFQLAAEETAVLRSRIATSKIALKDGRGGVRYRPYAFTEHGTIQAANILNSECAISMSVHVVRAFVQLREILSSNKIPAHNSCYWSDR